MDTARLKLRPFDLDDADVAFGWFGNPDVMRFMSAGADRNLSETRSRIERYRDHQRHHGFSKWIIVEKQSERAIGDAGLLVLPEVGPWPDLGVRLAKRCWGRGLATEAARAWVHQTFEVLGLGRLSAHAHVDNVASHHVLEKAGFARQGRAIIMNMDVETFACIPNSTSRPIAHDSTSI
jgi:RimJ/RimL family protein N-acetyltransferase